MEEFWDGWALVALNSVMILLMKESKKAKSFSIEVFNKLYLNNLIKIARNNKERNFLTLNKTNLRDFHTYGARVFVIDYTFYLHFKSLS